MSVSALPLTGNKCPVCLTDFEPKPIEEHYELGPGKMPMTINLPDTVICDCGAMLRKNDAAIWYLVGWRINKP